MASLSKIMQWCFVPNEKSEKHSSILHPLFSVAFGYLCTIYPTLKFTDYFENKYPNLKKDNFPPWAQKKLPLALAFYVGIILVTRLKVVGPVAFYDFLWACNVALVNLIIGLFKGSKLMVGSSMILISIDQMLWYLDVFGYILFKKFYIGVSAYLKWPDTPIIKKLTSTHHVWFIPLCFYLLKKEKNLNRYSYLLSLLSSAILVILGKVLAPKTIQLKNGDVIYANLNLAWEVWKDVKMKFLRIYEKENFLIYFLYHSFIWNGGNLGFFIILKGLLKLLEVKEKH